MIIFEFLVRNGKFDEGLITRTMLNDIAQYPGCSGTGKLADKIKNLKAQVTTNAKGATLVTDLTIERGLSTVHLNMHAITTNAKACIRAFLIHTHATIGSKPLYALYYMNDGTPIQVTITINPQMALYTLTSQAPATNDTNPSTPLRQLFAALLYMSSNF